MGVIDKENKYAAGGGLTRQTEYYSTEHKIG
jgi:hypothetical protein